MLELTAELGIPGIAAPPVGFDVAFDLAPAIAGATKHSNATTIMTPA